MRTWIVVQCSAAFSDLCRGEYEIIMAQWGIAMMCRNCSENRPHSPLGFTERHISIGVYAVYFPKVSIVKIGYAGKRTGKNTYGVGNVECVARRRGIADAGAGYLAWQILDGTKVDEARMQVAAHGPWEPLLVHTRMSEWFKVPNGFTIGDVRDDLIMMNEKTRSWVV